MLFQGMSQKWLSTERASDLRTRRSTSTRFNFKKFSMRAFKKKKDTPESFILLFFTKKVSTVIHTEGG